MPNEKSKQESYYIINMKLLSNDREGTEAYLDIMRGIHQKKIIIRVWSEASYIIRTQFSKTFEGQEMLYGKLARFTKIEEKPWLDLNKLEAVDYNLPEDLFPNLREVDYYFIPQAHRIAIKKASGFSPNPLRAFFEGAAKAVISNSEDIAVEYEKSIDSFLDILHSKEIRSIEIDLSYSNQDTNKEHAAFVDQQIRLMQAREVKIIAKADQHGTLSRNSPLLDGAIALTPSNGNAVAKVLDKDDNVRTIKTADYPAEIRVTFDDEEEKPLTLFQKVMQKFRP